MGAGASTILADANFSEETKKALDALPEKAKAECIAAVTGSAQIVPLAPALAPATATSSDDHQASLQAAADRIKSAEAVIIFTGAGMGADSGLGTYRGVNAGNFGVDYEEICQSKWFDWDPELAWGFWARCYDAYTNSTPHAGYDLLRAWAECKARGHFVVTSNVDGHWLRSSMSEARVWEVHGSAVHLQPCVKPKEGWAKDWAQADGSEAGGGPQVWRADPKVMASMVLPEWKLAPQQVVQVQQTWGGEWCEAIVADDSKTILSKGVPVKPYGLKENCEAPDLLRLLPGGARPSCPRGSGAALTWNVQADGSWTSSETVAVAEKARPNVLMFSDGAFNGARADQQRQVYYDWYESLPSDARLVVLEVGVGTVVPKIRGMAEVAAQAFERSTLIRINLGDMKHLCDGTDELEKDNRFIAVRLGALAALREIDRLMVSL